jgi:hypothetical protein
MAVTVSLGKWLLKCQTYAVPTSSSVKQTKNKLILVPLKHNDTTQPKTPCHLRRHESSSWFCLQAVVRHDSSASLSLTNQQLFQER